MTIGYHLEPPEKDQTIQTVNNWLEYARSGEYHPDATVGVEVEAVTYHANSTDLFLLTDLCGRFELNQHPELMHHMLETATQTTLNGLYPASPIEISQLLHKQLWKVIPLQVSKKACVLFSLVRK